MEYGIDVYELNCPETPEEWQAVADAGYTFAIVRSSYGKNSRDEKFLENVNGAHAAGLKVGAYHYDYALNPEEAIMNAVNCKNAIDEAGVLLELPVFYDLENDSYKDKNSFDLSSENVTAMAKAFLENIGLNAGVYANLDWMSNYIDWQSLNCPIWVAMYGDSRDSEEPDISEDPIKGFMWQWTDRKSLAGHQFDANVMY